MNKIRSITSLVFFFAVAAALFVPMPSMGQEGLNVNSSGIGVPPVRRSVPFGFFTLSPGEKWILALTFPKTFGQVEIDFIDDSGKLINVYLYGPVITPDDYNNTNRSRKNELLIFVTPKIVVENTGSQLVLTDPDGNPVTLRGEDESPEFGVVAVVASQQQPITSTITIQGGGETRSMGTSSAFKVRTDGIVTID